MLMSDEKVHRKMLML